MQEFKYFISFAHRGGFGNCTVIFNGPIEDITEIRQIEEHIESEHRIKHATVLHFQLLKEETEG